MKHRKPKIGITGYGSISACGADKESIWQAYLESGSCLQKQANGDWVGRIPEKVSAKVKELHQQKAYQSLDDSVYYAMVAAEQAVAKLDPEARTKLGLNIGSSRGATSLFEHYYSKFKEEELLQPLASPSTTLGNIASWTAHYIGALGLAFEHSITCSTALHALLNGVAWLESGRADYFLVGGSEAPLTKFTLAQMKALRIYASAEEKEYPCRSLDMTKSANSMVLGEGAACFLLEQNPTAPIAWIAGLGYAREQSRHATAISKDGEGFAISMKMALDEAGLEKVDAVVCHAPGTVKGDQAEIRALQQLWYKNMPLMTSNKWKIGHTLGASGALNIELALLMLENQYFIGTPFLDHSAKCPLESIMVNAMGFGGNAVSVILKK